MIFVDSNIPMYLIGAPHPHKIDAQRLLEQVFAQGERLVTDAEILQETLHRYRAIDRLDALHLAVMRRYCVACILTFDLGFDGVPGIVLIT